MVHPIAGTRWRGATPEEDAALADELLADPKERAEHLMLVDLGRNDLGRVCEPGSVEVVDFMSVERYSHVMHIVSTVVGHGRAGPHRLRRARRLLPGGHPVRRARSRARWRSSRSSSRPGAGSTAAASATSTSPATSTPRSRSAPRCCATASPTSRPAAGIVADSDPDAEDHECRNKAAAVLRAVAGGRHAAYGRQPVSTGPAVTTRRGMLIALGVTALGAVLVLATAGQPRWSRRASGTGGRRRAGRDGARPRGARRRRPAVPPARPRPAR